MQKQSEKDIAKRLDISVSKIDRKLNEISSHKVLRHETLPTSMNWDEFKATKDTKGKMAFIITNNESGNIFDIKDSRKIYDLEKYFKRYSRKERDKEKKDGIKETNLKNAKKMKEEKIPTETIMRITCYLLRI